MNYSGECLQKVDWIVGPREAEDGMSGCSTVMLVSHCGEYHCECKKIYSRQIRQKVANIRRIGLRMQFATNRNDRKMIARHS